MSEIKMIPNIISISRIILIIPIVYFYASPTEQSQWIALSLLALAWISDYLDGLIARRFSLQSHLGLILDPLADKLWTLAMIAMLYKFRNLPISIAIIVILRDVVIIGINHSMVRMGGEIMPSNQLGKKYMVLLGLMIITYTMRIEEAIWIAYAVLLLAPITIVSYAIRLRKVYILVRTRT